MLRGLVATALLLAGCASASTSSGASDGRRGAIVDRDGRVLAASFAAPRGQPERAYPYGGLMAHAVGYVGRSLKPEDAGTWVGRSAAERGFEAELSAGHEVALTLKVPLQRAAQRALAGQRAGAVVAMEPATGKLLALYSKPEFDPNLMSGRLDAATWARIRDDGGVPGPFIHRAVHGYSPAGLYTLVTALAGLETKAVTSTTSLACGGTVDLGGRRFHSRHGAGQGAVSLVEALARGCDAYFYRLGQRTTLEQVAPIAAMLGLGKSTGLRIGEHTGAIPESLKWYARHTKAGPMPGFRLLQAIGQGYVKTTPVQMARAVSAIVNGGTLRSARLVDRIAGESVPLEPGTRLTAVASSLQRLREGMAAAVAPGGVSVEVAGAASVAGLTGLAEVPRSFHRGKVALWLGQDHAWFAGYAPRDDPRVVLVVFVEHGKTTVSATNAARTFLDAWAALPR